MTRHELEQENYMLRKRLKYLQSWNTLLKLSLDSHRVAIQNYNLGNALKIIEVSYTKPIRHKQFVDSRKKKS